ncbi:uncharacterized protein LOC113472106, partial [Diaphorina citri]|uniref:Uncharacterized protein LOC113472106 n=1 Tax=Diaphorina citri TaxID=121845 RepID=A0A3Q0JKW1_DIACI
MVRVYIGIFLVCNVASIISGAAIDQQTPLAPAHLVNQDVPAPANAMPMPSDAAMGTPLNSAGVALNPPPMPLNSLNTAADAVALNPADILNVQNQLLTANNLDLTNLPNKAHEQFAAVEDSPAPPQGDSDLANVELDETVDKPNNYVQLILDAIEISMTPLTAAPAHERFAAVEESPAPPQGDSDLANVELDDTVDKPNNYVQLILDAIEISMTPLTAAPGKNADKSLDNLIKRLEQIKQRLDLFKKDILQLTQPIEATRIWPSQWIWRQ